MSKGNTLSEDEIRDKMCAYKVKVTTYLKGIDKNKFMLDCIKKGSYEGEITRNIINIHYSIIDELPFLKELEMDELKKYLIDKIKIK
mgnify:CR=1 FL=1